MVACALCRACSCAKMELAFTGAFAAAAWKIVGNLQRHTARVENAATNKDVLEGFEAYAQQQAKQVRPRSSWHLWIH